MSKIAIDTNILIYLHKKTGDSNKTNSRFLMSLILV